MPRRSLTDMGFVKDEVNLSVISRKLGVSISTVSRALRNASSIHPLTKNRILEEAKSLGYVWETEKETDKEPRNILMLSQVGNVSLDGPYLSGLSKAAVEFNISLIAHHYQPAECEQILSPALQPRALKSGDVDGIMLLHRWPTKVVKKLSSQLPVVSIVHAYPGIAVDVVGIEEREGMINLVRHLAAAGHRQIGFFGFCRSMSWARSRLGAYVESLSEVELDYHPGLKVNVSLAEALAENLIDPLPAADRVFDLVKQGVTAWIGASENLGYSLCKAALSRNLRVPEDVAITGFHASPSTGKHGLPSLTSTLSSPEDLGAAALRRMVTRIQNPEESRRYILLPCTYYQGQTTPDVKLPPLDSIED